MNLQQKISEYNIKENKYQNEILNLNKKLNEDIVTSKDDKQRYSVTEEINKNLSQKLENLQSEKTNIENATNILNNKYNNINIENTKIKNELNEARKKNNLLEQELFNIKKQLTSNENNQDLLLAESDLLHKIQKKINEIYQIHFGNINLNTNLNLQNNPDEVFIMLQNINEKLSSRNSALSNKEINFNENFANLENSKNSQLYENILLYLVNIRSKNKIELAKIMTEKNSQNISNNNSGEISQSMTHHSSSNYFNKKYYDELKYLLEDKYRKLEERIRQSITVGELEELLIEFKNLYEAVIDSIIQSFYIYKTELSSNNILTIEIPLDKYHQIINNTNTNLISIEKSLNKKINEYKTQGEKIESALSILIKNVNMIY
jgi:cell division protein ZapA